MFHSVAQGNEELLSTALVLSDFTMAGTMNVTQLTRADQELQVQMRDVAGRLTAAIPKIAQYVPDSASDITNMFGSLKAKFKPASKESSQPLRL